MPYLSASAVVIHYEEAVYQVYAPLPLLIQFKCIVICLHILKNFQYIHKIRPIQSLLLLYSALQLHSSVE